MSDFDRAVLAACRDCDNICAARLVELHHWPVGDTVEALRRLARAGLIRYDRDTHRWEVVG